MDGTKRQRLVRLPCQKCVVCGGDFNGHCLECCDGEHGERITLSITPAEAQALRNVVTMPGISNHEDYHYAAQALSRLPTDTGADDE